MGTNRKRLERYRTHTNPISGLELENLILGYNLLDGDEVFAPDGIEENRNDELRRESWNVHREYVLNLQGRKVQGEAFGLSNGIYFDYFTRPSGWWDYDAPEPMDESQRDYLIRLGLLNNAEKRR